MDELYQYEHIHGFDKTKAMVEFYSVPVWEYIDKRSRGEKTYCYDCGVEIAIGVRCDTCSNLIKERM